MEQKYTDIFNNIYEAVPQGKVFRFSYDCTTNSLRVICREHQAFTELQEAFSVKNEAAFFSERYGYKAKDRLYAINKFGFFSSGLIFEILCWIKDQYGSLNCVALSQKCKNYICDYLTPLKSLLKDNKFQIANVSDDTGRNNEIARSNGQPREFRDYQLKSVEELLFTGYGRGLIEIPTAGGKSFIIANFIWNILKNINRNAKTLILVPNTQLVSQFYSDLLDYGFDARDIAKFSGSLNKKEREQNDINAAKIVISNRQYIFKNKSMLPHIDVLVVDEVHTATAGSTKSFIESLDAKVKIGCSGTLPRDLYQKWQLIGMFGKVVFTEQITALQQRGFISQLDITLLKIRVKSIDNDSNLLFSLNTRWHFNADAVANGDSDLMFNDAYIAEKEYFTKYYEDLYKPAFQYLIGLKSNTLMLFDRIDIGTSLYEYAKKLYADKNVYYIDGSIDVHDREKIREQFEQSDGNLLIAQNAVMSTGVNIRRLSNLVFLTSSKAFSRTVQSIGRTLRLHSSKAKAHLIDLSWNTKYSQKHLEERLKIYKKMYNKRPDKIVQIDVD